MAFKDKSTKENITKHKALMSQETPYIKQYNTGGDIDLVNIQTGEVFETVKQFIKKPTKNKFTNDELPSSPFDEI